MLEESRSRGEGSTADRERLERSFAVLVVDDQPSARRVLTSLLAKIPGTRTVEASSVDEARAVLSHQVFDVALVDIRLQADVRDRSGLTLIGELRANTTTTPVVVTAAGEMAHIRAAMRLGAYDFILKEELGPALVIPMLEELRDRKQLLSEVVTLRARTAPENGLAKLVGTSQAMTELRARIRKVSVSTRPVLVTGPTGCGKELVAQAIHHCGRHPDAPLLDVNCGALPENLVESQLFGHERGAFTGAERRHPGFFGAAGDGTLFLDEVGELALPLQAKLLRVLETSRYRPVGATGDLQFRGRVVAATHRDLREGVDKGTFREDLFFRLNVLPVPVPSLDERREDIPGLVAHFIADRPRALRFSDEAMAALVSAEWPGNIRQLKNLLDRLEVFAENDRIDLQELQTMRELDTSPDRLGQIARTIIALPQRNKLEALDRALASEALLLTRGNKSAAARLLGIDRKALDRKLPHPAEEPSSDDTLT